MANNDTPWDGECPADPSEPSRRRELTAPQSRRRLLETLTGGALTMLAGCGLFGSSTTPREDASTIQTLRLPVRENAPNKTSFYPLAPESTFAKVVKEKPAGKLDNFVWEQGMWPDGLWLGGDVQYTWIDDITISPTEVTISIDDNAKWSDGHQITGQDIAVPIMDYTIDRFFRPYYASDKKDEPLYPKGAFDEFEITEQSVTYRSTPGYFEQFWDWSIKTWLGIWGLQGDAPVPTHIEPYQAYGEAVVETVRRAQKGEINPWGSERYPGRGGSGPTKQALRDKHLDDRKYVKKFSQPENVLAIGAWDLVELRGSEAFVFRKNPHHRNVGDINFEKVILEYMPSDEREQMDLKAGRLDYRSGVTPQSVVESLPANVTQLLIPGGWASGNEIGLNFDHPALGDRKIRLAIMYALDHGVIANNVHQSAARPVTSPGGDCWDATDYVNQQWIDENLTTYAQDREKASTLMQETEYTKNGGKWVGPDGEPLTLTLTTDTDTPRWEPTVASQLSEFGIQTSIKRVSETTFESRVKRGEFPMWASHLGNSTSTAASTLSLWIDAPQNHKKYGIYPDKQFETGRFTPTGKPRPLTEERFSDFSIKAPPIGQQNGQLKEYHPSALSLYFLTNPPKDEFHHRVKIGMWLANWLLPTIPINKTLEQHFINDARWSWPTDTPSWKNFTNGGPRDIMGILASGNIRANPDNQEV